MTTNKPMVKLLIIRKQTKIQLQLKLIKNNLQQLKLQVKMVKLKHSLIRHQVQSHHLQAASHKKLNRRKSMTMPFKSTKMVNGSYKTRRLIKITLVSNTLKIKIRPFTTIQQTVQWFTANKRSTINGTTLTKLRVP